MRFIYSPGLQSGFIKKNIRKASLQCMCTISKCILSNFVIICNIKKTSVLTCKIFLRPSYLMVHLVYTYYIYYVVLH